MRVITLLFLLISFSSCTHLQYRLSDRETIKAFDSLQVPTEISYHYVPKDDYLIRVQKVESTTDSKLNILFLHGSPSSISDFKPYLSEPELRKQATLYAIDRPGYGYSDFADAMPGIDDQTQLLNEVINQLALTDLIVVGSSYGAPIAGRLAVYNKNVKGVIMLSPAIDPENEKEIWQSRFTQWWITRWMVPTSYRVAGDEKTIHAKELAKIENDWRKVSIPVLHIHGTADQTVPFINTEFTKEVFSNIEIKVYEGYDHDLTGMHHELIIPDIKKFIDKHFK